jgi:hypothetical protein
MNKYEYILKSLNFTKIGRSFLLERFSDNILSLQIMMATTPDSVTKDHWYYSNLKKYLDDTESYMSIKSITIKDFEQNRLNDLLNINIVYDGGNSEYTMPFEKNFDSIFLEALREGRDKKLNSIL